MRPILRSIGRASARARRREHERETQAAIGLLMPNSKLTARVVERRGLDWPTYR